MNYQSTMAQSFRNSGIDTFLSEKLPLEKKKTFYHVKSMAFWALLFGIYFLFIINDWQVQHTSRSKEVILEPIREILEELNKNHSHIGATLLVYTASTVMVIILSFICWKFTRIITWISIAICTVIASIAVLIYIFSLFTVFTNPAFLLMMLVFGCIFGSILFSAYYSIATVGIDEISELLNQSYEAVSKYSLLIFSPVFLSLPYIFIVKVEIHACMGLIKYFEIEQLQVMIFLYAIHTWLINIFFLIFLIMFVSKIAVKYWAEDKNSDSQFKTVLEALWTTIRYDLGLIAYGLSPWSLITVISTTWNNAFNNKDFQQLHPIFKIFFSIHSLGANYLNGFSIGAYHNSGFPESTKFGGFLFFKNALKFFSVVIVQAIITGFKFTIVSSVILYALIVSGEIDYHDAKNIKLTTLMTPVTLFMYFIYISLSTMLLYKFESFERNNRSTA